MAVRAPVDGFSEYAVTVPSPEFVAYKNLPEGSTVIPAVEFPAGNGDPEIFVMLPSAFMSKPDMDFSGWPVIELKPLETYKNLPLGSDVTPNGPAPVGNESPTDVSDPSSPLIANPETALLPRSVA